MFLIFRFILFCIYAHVCQPVLIVPLKKILVVSGDLFHHHHVCGGGCWVDGLLRMCPPTFKAIAFLELSWLTESQYFSFPPLISSVLADCPGHCSPISPLTHNSRAECPTRSCYWPAPYLCWIYRCLSGTNSILPPHPHVPEPVSGG